ncbi:MAG: SGNH/GDSL hydrolase family protein [Clostridia bacterium]|nr:SGNH/GDSL hydrolase family protein [Clostridia bacterium]
MENNIVLEKYEWDNTWSDFSDDINKPRVLYIGDSISCGTKHIATARCGKKMIFDGFGTSKSLDNPYFIDCLELFVKQLPRVDTIIFNNGLHGWHLSDNADYGYYYEEMVKYLLKRFPKSSLHIVLTSYTSYADYKDRVSERNKVALGIAQKYSLPVIDIYSVTKENSHLLCDDEVHFVKEGYEIIADTINSALKCNTYVN